MEVSNDWEQVNDTLIFEYWFIAILVHIFGNIISSTRWCIQENKQNNCGLIMHYIGDIISKLSYGFGPIALLLPLQSLIVVFNALFKSKYTNNDISKKQVIGMITILIGLSITIICGPRCYSSYYTIQDILFKFNESSSIFIINILLIFVIINWLILITHCKYKTDEFYMLTFVHISAYFGAWNIVFIKCILQLISSSLLSTEYANLNWTHWLSYLVVLSFILSLIGVETWKRKALLKYQTEYVIAIYTFLLIIIGTILGSMLFDEFNEMTLSYLIAYFLSILISFVGITIVSFKQYDEYNKDWAYRHNIEMIPSRVKSEDKDNDKSDTRYRNSNGINPETWHNTPWNEKQLNWQIIGQILMDHEFVDTVEATNATLDHLEDFFEEEDILSDEFRDALCSSCCNINDEGTVLWQVLFHTLNYSKQRRLRLYDLVLHEYFTLSDMTVSNLIQILSKMTRDLNVSPKEFGKIKEILLNKKLDGFKFEAMDSTQFILLFRSVRSVEQSVWCLIYETLMYWSFQEFEGSNTIDWESVGTVLWDNNFCNDQDELNSCLDELELYFQKENLGPNVLKQEICVCYGNKADKESILRNILFSVMRYSKQKRLSFYDILLHKYMDIESLNTFQLINVLKRSVIVVDKDIDLIEFESIATLHKLNGRDLSSMRSAEHFANVFETLKTFDSSVWEKIYYEEMAKWQQTPTEYEHSVSPSTALHRLKTPSFKQIKNRLMKSPQSIRTKNDNEEHSHHYMKIVNDESKDDDDTEIADVLIDILEDVALSNEPYVPSKRAVSQSRSRSKKKGNKHKRRRPSTAHKIFPRERAQNGILSTESTFIFNSDIIDLMNLDEYLKYVIEAGFHFNEKRLLSYAIDSYDLVRCNDINMDLNISQFVETSKYFKKVEHYIINKHNLQNKYTKTGDFISKTFDEYYILFGHKISFSPNIKIDDSMGSFMSYTFSMSNAIKRYMNPAPQICPLMVDLWIIPNKTVSVSDNNVIVNGIGDIQQRLISNKLRYIKKCCSSSDIVQTTYNIQECLCSANIRHGLKHGNVNRVVFIIDRRYEGKDYLYCYIPPSKYAKISSTNDDDTFHINHMYHTSRYLLPSTSPNNHNSIGASDNCNGYMFALSFVIYKYNNCNNLFKTKIYFYSQGGKLRFIPNHMSVLWPKYFVNENDDKYEKYDIEKIVENVFTLDIDDPYFSKLCVINKYNNGMRTDTKEECMEQLREWASYQKTQCQTNVPYDHDIMSKQQIHSMTSTNTTPTTQIITPLSNNDVFIQQQKANIKQDTVLESRQHQNGLIIL